MKELVVKFLLRTVLKSKTFYSLVFSGLKQLVERTDTEVDNKVYNKIPSFIKGLKVFLKDIGYEDSEVIEILVIIKQAYVDGDVETDEEVLKELEDEVKN